MNLNCDWHELTDARAGESLARAPVRPGDVLLGDRNFFQPQDVRAVVDGDAHVLIRLRWNHPGMLNQEGLPFEAPSHAQRLRVEQVGQWKVRLVFARARPLSGRVVAIRLPRAVQWPNGPNGMDISITHVLRTPTRAIVSAPPGPYTLPS